MLDPAKHTIEAKSDPDFPGLSFAYRFRDGQAEPLSGRDIPAALAEPGGWIWIHLSLVDIYARNWIKDEIAAKVAAETNRHLFVLTILTAFLLPPTLVSGIFGMNVSDLPFTKDPGGFTWALGLIIFSILLVYVIMRVLRITR